jgi:hypothetical protein
MVDNASDTVPTESAVRGYVNRRLGYDVTGAPVANKLGPGVLAPNGAVPMTDDLNAAGNTITNLGLPVQPADAATKLYVDGGRGDMDEIKDLRSVEYNNIDANQLLVSTGKKKLILDAGSILGGGFTATDIITGSISGATGAIIDVVDGLVGIEGNIVEITYTVLTGVFSDGKPADGPAADVLTAPGGKQGNVVDGPVDEWANGVANPASDIQIITNRAVGAARETTLNLQINANAITNTEISPTAQIAQSKLNLNAATTRANAVAISQSDLGSVSFDSAKFTVTAGWVTTATGSIVLSDIENIATDTVLGRSAVGSGEVSEITFATVVDEGLGLADGDFDTEILAAANPGEALIKTGAGTYGISNVSTTGEVNSIVKTDADGKIQANSLILGGEQSYEVLSLDTLTLQVKTPAQGLIFTAVSGSAGTGNLGDPGYVAPTYPNMLVKGSVGIGGTGISESILQGTSNFTSEKVLGVDWIYSSFIEAPGEKGAASTAIAIGANTGKTTAGQVGIVTADAASASSVVPAVFSSTGMVPDTDNTYDIGSATKKYKDVYATLFRGTATESYYADLAENYLADAEYAPGTVIEFGGEAEVTQSTTHGTHRVAGVVSTNPAHLMNSHCEGDNVVAVALQGRVPCNVIGKVAKGDMLVASNIPGYAIVNNTPAVGSVIGKALGTKLDGERGTVEVVVGKH